MLRLNEKYLKSKSPDAKDFRFLLSYRRSYFTLSESGVEGQKFNADGSL
jgi:hypothetical protein